MTVEIGRPCPLLVVRHYGMWQRWLHDPDSYEICLQWPAS